MMTFIREWTFWRIRVSSSVQDVAKLMDITAIIVDQCVHSGLVEFLGRYVYRPVGTAY
jgi:hypothetical protein